MITNKTCILLFTRTPAQEAVYKQYSAQSNHNSLISRHLFRQAKALVQASRIPYIITTEQEQVGVTFGQRFTHAIEDAFRQGFQQLVVIGADSPALNQNDITKAIIAVEKGQVVLGPAKDGGVYLLGINAAQFNSEDFQEFSWQSSKVGQQLQEWLQRQCYTIQLLRTLVDIDTEASLRQIIHLTFHAFIKLLKGLFFWVPPTRKTLLPVEQAAVFPHHLRGPPLFSSSSIPF